MQNKTISGQLMEQDRLWTRAFGNSGNGNGKWKQSNLDAHVKLISMKPLINDYLYTKTTRAKNE